MNHLKGWISNLFFFKVRKSAKRCLFLIPNLRTRASIRKQRKIGHKTRFLNFGSPNRIVNSHIRFRSMGPFHYVRLELRLCSFSSTGVSNLRFSSLWEQAKLKPTTRVGCNSGRAICAIHELILFMNCCRSGKK